MKANKLAITVLVALLLGSGAGLRAANSGSNTDAKVWRLVLPDHVKWQPSKLLPPGAQSAVLEGDPSKPGFFTMRIRMPDGYRIPPHWHSQQERVTVLAGVLYLGMGKRFKAASAKALGRWAYSSIPPGMAHFGWTRGQTVLQLSGIGPWTVTYAEPGDDPRVVGRTSHGH